MHGNYEDGMTNKHLGLRLTGQFFTLAACIAIGALTLLRSPSSYAEATPPSATKAASVQEDDTLQEIVITSTRQQTTIQGTPITITAFTSDQMTSLGITDIDALVTSVPAVSVRNAGGAGEEEYEIRGLNSQGGSSSMVGMYFGDIPLSSFIGSQLGKNVTDVGMYDVERVEVLEGPQGTLYGSSSMGGTIRILPKAPKLGTDEASLQEVASQTADGGGFNHQENGMMNIPLGDTAALRVVGSFANNSGWVQQRVIQDGAVTVDPGTYPAVSRPSNFYTAPLQQLTNGANTSQIDSIRASILWQPTDNLTIEPVVLYQQVQQGAPPAVDVNGSPTHPTTPSVWAHWEIYPTPESQTDRMSFVSLKMVYQLPLFSITSDTGFWHRNLIDTQDCTEQLNSVFGIAAYDAAQGGLGPCESNRGMGSYEQDSARQLSDEIRLTSTVPGPLQWVAGYFYQDLHSAYNALSLSPQGASILGGPIDSYGNVPQVMVQNALYAHATWRPIDQFEIAAGFRSYHYSLSSLATQYGAFSVTAGQGNNIPYTFASGDSAGGTVPSVTLTYHYDSEHMLYLKVDEGFRLGGASNLTGPIPVVAASNTNPLLAAQVANECGLQAKVLLTTTCNPNLLLQAPTTYSSDHVWSYELGEKSSFFNRRLIVDLDGYLEQWSDPQTPTSLAGYALTVNGGHARITGVEAHVEGLLPGGFDASINGAYTDAKYTVSSAITGYPAGTAIPDTPKVTASAILGWRHNLPSSNGLSLFGSLEEDYTGARTDLPLGVTATLLNMDQLLVHMPAYSMVNLRFGVDKGVDAGNRWSATMFVHNLTNKMVLLDPQPQVVLLNGAFNRFVISQPLTAGIDLSYRFH